MGDNECTNCIYFRKGTQMASGKTGCYYPSNIIKADKIMTGSAKIGENLPKQKVDFPTSRCSEINKNNNCRWHIEKTK